MYESYIDYTKIFIDMTEWLYTNVLRKIMNYFVVLFQTDIDQLLLSTWIWKVYRTNSYAVKVKLYLRLTVGQISTLQIWKLQAIK